MPSVTQIIYGSVVKSEVSIAIHLQSEQIRSSTELELQAHINKST